MGSRGRRWVGRLVAMGSLPALPDGSGWNCGAGRRLLPLLLVSVRRGKGEEREEARAFPRAEGETRSGERGGRRQATGAREGQGAGESAILCPCGMSYFI